MLLRTLKNFCASLSQTGFIVCSIVTDNGGNKIAAVRGLARELRAPLFCIPCVSHTTALALKDFVTHAFPLISARDLFAATIDLWNLLPHVRERDIFHANTPTMQIFHHLPLRP
jgi:hypothetical protein